MASSKEQDAKLDTAIEYAKKEALSGLTVQFLQILYSNSTLNLPQNRTRRNIDNPSIIQKDKVNNK